MKALVILAAVVISQPPPPVFTPLDYVEARQIAEKSELPLVTAIRCESPSGKWVRCRSEIWEWGEGSFLILSRDGLHIADLPATATAKQIHDRLYPPPPPPPTATNLHSHRCPSCGTVWSHSHDSFGKVADHRCPNCGVGPVWSIYRVAPSAVISTPRSPMNCPNGNCPYGR